MLVARLAILALVLPRWLALLYFFLSGGCQRAFRGTLNGAPLGSDQSSTYLLKIAI